MVQRELLRSSMNNDANDPDGKKRKRDESPDAEEGEKKKRKKLRRKKPKKTKVKSEDQQSSGVLEDDKDDSSDSSADSYQQSATTARRILWQRGHQANLPSKVQQIIRDATVSCIQDALRPLQDIGFAIVQDFTTVFHPKHRCTAEQKDFIHKRKFNTHLLCAVSRHKLKQNLDG